MGMWEGRSELTALVGMWDGRSELTAMAGFAEWKGSTVQKGTVDSWEDMKFEVHRYCDSTDSRKDNVH
uniref:DUF1579 domain-containing protein n=1 Tax=Parascaris equorum TaxID=6256 RepID=A0A914RZL7_PAREQ